MITPDILQRVQTKLDYCIDVCQEKKGNTSNVCDQSISDETLFVYASVATNIVQILIKF